MEGGVEIVCVDWGARPVDGAGYKQTALLLSLITCSLHFKV